MTLYILAEDEEELDEEEFEDGITEDEDDDLYFFPSELKDNY